MPRRVRAFPEKWWFGSRTCEHRPLEGAIGRRRRGSRPIDNVEATHRHASSFRECNEEDGGKFALCPSSPSCEKGLTGRTRSERSPLDMGFRSVRACRGTKAGPRAAATLRYML